MTELKDSRFTELLPSDLKNDTETQAFAYAVSRQVQQIIRFADAACIYIAIDSVPEPVLDLLAVELRTPVYKQTYSVAIKRALVKESLIFYDQMGTPAAVNRIIEAVCVECVIALSKGEIDSKKVRVEFSLEGMDTSGLQKGATYPEIKARVLEQTGLKVSSLYISQVKQKCGLEVRENHHKAKSENVKQPQCPKEKEDAIVEALKHFQMI